MYARYTVGLVGEGTDPAGCMMEGMCSEYGGEAEYQSCCQRREDRVGLQLPRLSRS